MDEGDELSHEPVAQEKQRQADLSLLLCLR
jgi:hypothetical protein